MVTSARYDDPDHGPRVLHFAVPMTSEGVTMGSDWRALGMRGTGSHALTLENVFVPDGAISLDRPRGEWHTVWNVVVVVAMPLIMSAYAGVAESAAEIARSRAASAPEKAADFTPYLLGEMENALTATRVAVDSMIAIANDHEFAPTIENADAVLRRKTLAARSAIDTVEKAMEVVGGAGYYRGFGLERLLRDVKAAHYHPLAEKKQLLFSGRLAMGLDPVV